MKQAENGEGYTVRLYEGAGENSEAVVRIPSLGIEKKVALRPYELMTLHLDEQNRTLQTAQILD